MFENLQEAFRSQDPELVLLGFDSGAALFEMRCDGYKTGLMRCVGVRALCMTTRTGAFGRIARYTCDALPEVLRPLAEGMLPEEVALVFSLSDDCLSEDSVLPEIGGQRLAYVLCESVEYQEVRAE